jgi:hypothetical protein
MKHLCFFNFWVCRVFWVLVGLFAFIRSYCWEGDFYFYFLLPAVAIAAWIASFSPAAGLRFAAGSLTSRR